MFQIRPEDAQRRRFNPERDLVWMLPRLIKRALTTFGTLSEAALQQLLHQAHIGDDTCLDDFSLFISNLTGFLAAAIHPEDHTPEQVRCSLQAVYGQDTARIRLLVFDRIIKVLMAEYPIWCDQVRPESELDPRPSIEDVEKAGDELLGRLP